MKIAYIIPSKRKFGPIIVVYELVSQLVKKGHDVTVFYFDDYHENVYEFPCKTQKIGFFEKINFKEYDIVHSNTLRPDLYVFIHKPYRTISTRFITTIHNFVIEDLSSEYNSLIGFIFGHLWMFILRRHDYKVVLSEVAKKYYRRWFLEKEMVVIYNSRSINFSQSLSKDEEDELIKFKGDSILLGANAMLTPRKGFDMVLRAMTKNKKLKFFLVGDGKSKNDLYALAKELGILDRVFWAGYRENAFRYIPFYDIYMMPSRSEGFGLALLEAVALKCNVVASDIPIFRELFNDNEVNFFEIDNMKSLSEAIDKAMKVDKTEAAFKKYVQKYSLDIFVERYLDAYGLHELL